MTRDNQALTASTVDGTQDEQQVRAITGLVMQAIGRTDCWKP
jgi:hypothetical protein